MAHAPGGRDWAAQEGFPEWGWGGVITSNLGLIKPAGMTVYQAKGQMQGMGGWPEAQVWSGRSGGRGGGRQDEEAAATLALWEAGARQRETGGGGPALVNSEALTRTEM